MNLVTPRQSFSDHLQLVAALCPSRSLKPVFKDVLLTVDGSEVSMVATNGDVAIRSRCQGDGIKGDGSAAVPASTLLAAVRLLPGEDVRWVEKGGQHEISSGGAVFRLVGDDPALFPSVASIDLSKAVEVPLSAFIGLCERTMFAAAKDMGRYAFNGVLLELSPRQLTLVATDGRRLALAGLECNTGRSETASHIIPMEGLMQLQRAAAAVDANTLALELRENQVIFALGSAEIVAQLVEGEFPDYRAVLPKEKDAPRQVQLQREALEDAIRRAAVTAGEEGRSVEMSFQSGLLSVSSRQEGLGEAHSKIDVDYKGDEVAIKFNPEFLVDYLRATTDDVVTFRFKDRTSAGFFGSSPAELYVVMPITS